MPSNLSTVEQLIQQNQLDEFIDSLTKKEQEHLLYDWPFWARPKQLDPTGGTIWLIQAGRGFGKTRSGAEWVRQRINAGTAKRIALVGRTAPDVRDVMIEGESGLMSISPPWAKPHYEPSKRRVTWYRNGHDPNQSTKMQEAIATATVYSAEEPDLLRGPQHDTVWADEPAHWPRAMDVWHNIRLGLRLGNDPRICATTTPKSTPLIKKLEAQEGSAVVITRGSTRENTNNLSQAFIDEVITSYEGTRLGRQEIEGELLDTVEGALWTPELIEQARVPTAPPNLTQVVVAVDPSGGGDDEQGIIVVGKHTDGKCYILSDQSCRLSPSGWGRKVVNAYQQFAADAVLWEANFGGEMVKHTVEVAAEYLNVPRIRFKKVWASRGKQLRAEPVAAQYGDPEDIANSEPRVLHPDDTTLFQLEDQMVSWTPESKHSPDRLDALVMAVTHLQGMKKGLAKITMPKQRIGI